MSGTAPRSVNWTTGMLLTPEHFRLQDAYVDASVGWVLRHCVAAAGLVGGGVRLVPAQRGLARFDPRVEVADDGETVRVAVVEARGITPSGEPVEVGGGDVVRGEFRKPDLAGATELLVHVVRDEGKEPDDDSVGADAANPDQPALLRPRWRVSLGAPADVAPRALVVGRIRRTSQALAFEADGGFIPPCASVMAHSEMYSGWASLHGEVVALAGEYAELHRTVARYAERVAQRGVDTVGDREILAFVERAVLALDGCAYATLDPAQAPGHLFREVERAARRVAIALDLSTATQLFVQSLTAVDAGYVGLLEEERQALSRGRDWQPGGELRHSLDLAAQTLARLRALCRALEGKYVDYRVNSSIGALRFLLDREGEEFYLAVGTPGHPQGDGNLLTFVFGNLSLAGRHEYRVVLLGDPQGISEWRPGETLHVDVRVNAASGPAQPFSRDVPCEIPGQRNFAVNFETPAEFAAISGLQVTAQPGHRIRGAVLYQRRLGLADAAAPAPLAPVVPVVAPATVIPPSPAPTAAISPNQPSLGRIRIRKS